MVCPVALEEPVVDALKKSVRENASADRKSVSNKFN
jgi:hypothetical protein